MTELLKKLQIKNHSPILVLSAPDSFENELRALENLALANYRADSGLLYEFALIFALDKSDLLIKLAEVLPSLSVQANVLVWFAYPKQSSKKYTSDLNRDIVRETLIDYDLNSVRQISIDDDWSAMRFKRV